MCLEFEYVSACIFCKIVYHEPGISGNIKFIYRHVLYMNGRKNQE